MQINSLKKGRSKLFSLIPISLLISERGAAYVFVYLFKQVKECGMRHLGSIGAETQILVLHDGTFLSSCLRKLQEFLKPEMYAFSRERVQDNAYG